MSNMADKQPQMEAVTRLPHAPKTLVTDEEREAWRVLWRALIAARTAATTDAFFVECAARAKAKIDQAWQDGDLKVATLTSMTRLYKEILRDLGLSPATRNSISALPTPTPEADEAEEFK